MCATMENFSLLSSHPNPPTVLHFSGHGFECDEEYEYLQNNLFNYNGNLLVFEDENCQANYVPQTWISGHIKSSNMLQQLQLVVILSCHSEAIGKVFFEAGVKHVICIRQNQEVSDDVSNMFANQFYGLLFKGDLSICQIFYKTLLNMENHPDNEIQKEAKKFIMFRQGDYPYDTEEYKAATEKQKKKIALAFYQKMRTFDYNTCKCSKLKPNGNLRGEHQEQIKNEEQVHKYPVTEVDDVLQRNQEMHKIIKNINENRLVTVRGRAGIGKKEITNKVALLLEERRAFRNGIIHIELKFSQNAAMLV